jgi:hypothetical protein
MIRNRNTGLSTMLAVCGLAASAFEPRRNMIVSSPIFNEISGKLGGAVGLTTRFGMQLRGLVTPNNPDSGPQFIVRNIVSTLSSLWTSTLTSVERASWTNLAEDTPGSSDGKGLYVAANALRLRVDDPINPRVDTAPVSASAPFNDTPTDVILEVGVGTHSLKFTLPASGADYTDSWALLDGGFLAYSVSRPQRATRLTKIKPYVFIGHKNGDTTSGSRPVGAQSVSLDDASFNGAFDALDVGDVCYVSFQASDSLGRITSKFTLRVTATAP